MKQFISISKVDSEKQMVWGYASTEQVDSDGETVTQEAMKDAWADYMKFGNIREMHQPKAAGVVKEYNFDDVGVEIGVKVVDTEAWSKVVEGVYKGFSIGGKKVKGGYDPVSKTITALELVEISLVDRPANPGAVITVWKSQQLEDNDMDNEQVENSAENEELTAIIAKGEISNARILELVKQDLEKSADTNDNQQDGDGNSVTEETIQLSKFAKDLADLKKAKENGEIEKNMYDVGWLAEIVNSLRHLYSSVQYEETFEGDGSTLSEKIAEEVIALGNLLLEMVVEELGELAELVTKGAEADSLTNLEAIVNELTPEKPAVEKSENAEPEGDAVPEVAEPTEEDIATDASSVDKAASADETVVKTESNDIEKLSKTVNDLISKVDSLTTKNNELEEKNEKLTKAFENAPSTPKGQLKVVEKGADVTEGDDIEVAPVLKQDGTVDEVATSIKKVHQGGGRGLNLVTKG